MIIAKITQDNLELTIQEINIPYQHSQGLEIEFVRDVKYKDYTLLSFYKLEGDVEAKLMECNNDIISIGKDVFKKVGKVSFSFSLTKDKEVIHLGVVEFYVRRAFGDNDSILPQEDKNTWIDLISNVAKDGVDNYWNAFYKEEIENIVNDINSKVSAASNYASQANLAKTEASKSVTNAGNSASSALTNANKAKEHLTNIVEKTNTFNADYASKVNNFNTSVENVNTALDAKISTANTSLDKKIVDANGVIDAKVTEATTQANIATTKATELKDAVDKVKYLEDVVDTKLTQPYVSSPAIENGTISDSDEGQLRNLKIYGKCTQKVETDIVPTPEREVPIVSKKITVNGETVELRSLKESVNLFDLGLLSKTELIPKAGAYRKIDIPLQLKPSTKYTFSYDSWEVPALSWPVLKIVNTDDTTLAGVFNYKNNTINAQVKDKINTTFTTDATGKTYFSYYVSEFNENGSSISQSTSTFERLWFTKLLKNIMLVEGTTVPSSYVAATTRDYKIVDHTNKKSWIERNVIQKNLVNLNPQKIEHSKFIVTYVYTTKPAGKESSWNNIFCNNFAIYPYNGFPADIKEGIHVSQYGIYVVLDDKRNVTTIEEYKEWIKDNPIIVNYQIATSFTEEIPYLENDQSEFGQSFQDTTSPSPTIKNEIEKVTEINIKTCGKNLLDYTKYSSLQNVLFENGTFKLKTGVAYGFIYYRENLDSLLNKIITVSGAHTNDVVFSIKGTDENDRELNKLVQNFPYFIDTTPFKTITEFTFQLLSGATLKDIQIEEGDIATEYEPYQETAISHVLEEPLLKVGDKADTIDLVNLARKNNIYKEDLTTLTISSTDNNGMYNHINTTNRFYNLNVSSNAKASPTHQNVMSSILPYVQSVWLYDKTGITINYQQVHVSLPNLLLGINSKDASAERTKKLDAYIKSLKRTGNEYIYYAVEEPSIEPLESELIEKLKTLMSFYPVTHIFSNGPLEFDYKLNLENWHKVVSGEVEDAKDVIYNMQVQQNNLEVIQLQSALETQYNLDLMKLGGM